MTAVDLVAALRVGEGFTLNGRPFTVADGCVSDYADRRTLYAWNAAGRRVLVTVRPESRVIVAAGE